MEAEGLDEKGMEDDDFVAVDVLFGTGAGLEMESAATADLDVNVDGGALSWTGFLTGAGFFEFRGLVERAASVARYFFSAAFLLSRLMVHSISTHSGLWMQGICMLSNSRNRRASAFLSATSASFCRCFASRSL